MYFGVCSSIYSRFFFNHKFSRFYFHYQGVANFEREPTVVYQFFFKINCMSRPDLLYFCFHLTHHSKHRRIHLSVQAKIFKLLHTVVYTVVYKYLYASINYGIY